MTWFWRYNDVIIAPCVQWDLSWRDICLLSQKSCIFFNCVRIVRSKCREIWTRLHFKFVVNGTYSNAKMTECLKCWARFFRDVYIYAYMQHNVYIIALALASESYPNAEMATNSLRHITKYDLFPDVVVCCILDIVSRISDRRKLLDNACQFQMEQ